jgi:anti-sigma factor RsiW
MESHCSIDGETLSRFLDGELALSDYRGVRDHLPSCPRCTERLSQFRLVSHAASRAGVPPISVAPAGRLVASLSVAAALVASMATNLLLTPGDSAGPRPAALTLSEAPSQNLSSFYEALSLPQARR